VTGRDIRTDSEWIKRRIGYMASLFSLYNDLTSRRTSRSSRVYE